MPMAAAEAEEECWVVAAVTAVTGGGSASADRGHAESESACRSSSCTSIPRTADDPLAAILETVEQMPLEQPRRLQLQGL